MASSGNAPEGILLINPPFSYLKGPYGAIPQLAGYLKSKGIPVRAEDLGAQFSRDFLTPAAVANGARHASERFRELNDEKNLGPRQKVEYNILLRVLREYTLRAGMINWLAMPFADFADIQESEAQAHLMLLASMPYFPEIFLADHKYMNPSRFSPFSTRQILASTSDRSHYTNLFGKAIDRLWASAPPRIAGFSIVFSNQIIPAFQMAAMIKRRDARVHITMGGPTISIFFRRLGNPDLFDLIDSLIIDDGEIPLELLYHAVGGQNGAVDEIPGVICRKDGRVYRKTAAEPLAIGDLPAPDLSVFDLDVYLVKKDRLFFPIRLGRGCSWQKCAFCRTDHPLCRMHQESGVAHIFELLRQLYHEQGLRNFFFSTESADPLLLEQLCRRILKEGLSIEWVTHTRVSREMSKARCELFAKAGCRHMAVGVESLSDRILQLMRKGITVNLVRKVLGEIGGALPLTAYMMVGFPSETRGEALATYESISRLKALGQLYAFSYSMFVLQQGSEIFANPSGFGITLPEIDPEEDLSPDLVGFTGDGMSRQEAFELYLRFIKEQLYPGASSASLQEIRIDGKQVRLRHDPEALRQAAKEQWRALVMPFGKWMDQL